VLAASREHFWGASGWPQSCKDVGDDKHAPLVPTDRRGVESIPLKGMMGEASKTEAQASKAAISDVPDRVSAFPPISPAKSRAPAFRGTCEFDARGAQNSEAGTGHYNEKPPPITLEHGRAQAASSTYPCSKPCSLSPLAGREGGVRGSPTEEGADCGVLRAFQQTLRLRGEDPLYPELAEQMSATFRPIPARRGEKGCRLSLINGGDRKSPLHHTRVNAPLLAHSYHGYHLQIS